MAPTALMQESPFANEASTFPSNHVNYIALGCLSFVASQHTDAFSSNGWQMLDCINPEYGCTVKLAADLNRLLRAGLIKVAARRSILDARLIIYRVYILSADAASQSVDQRRFFPTLEAVVRSIDTSPAIWNGNARSSDDQQRLDVYATAEEGSLFYIFNTLPSPSPSLRAIEDSYLREALEDVLEPDSALPGLKSILYAYQRRSVGAMLQREASPVLVLDPRLEQRTAPDGSNFYFSPRDMVFFHDPQYFTACRGGMLSEGMGLGKTVMVLALIVATQHHPPRVPPPHNLPPVRSKVASLSEMAVSSIVRHSVPWKVEFARIKHASSEEPLGCIAKLEACPAQYLIAQEPGRWNRRTVLPPPKVMRLAATTLIVVPSNLFKQWQSEMDKHVEPGTLKVLSMDNLRTPLPSPDVLCTYDVILFTRERWQHEHRDGSDQQGRRKNNRVCQCSYKGATRIRDCQCVQIDSLYDSPLKYVHFKRLIVDEGHFFSNTNSKAVQVANSLVTVDHRWVMSGTPAKDLFSVDVGEDDCQSVLSLRKAFTEEDLTGAVKSFRNLTAKFFDMRPWAAPERSERADWDEYIYRHEGQRRTYSGFSSSMRRTLESLIVRTRPEDVYKDLEIPALSHQVVRLEPSFYDKLTANLFVLVLTANAVTSERRDVDYLFHKNSLKARHQLVSNLRQSAFFWTGFSEADIHSSIEASEKYLAKEETQCLAQDRMQLMKMLHFAKKVLTSTGWLAVSRTHELGFFVRDWPQEYAEHWGFDQAGSLLLTGVSQILTAQQHVNQQADLADPGSGLAGVGIRSLLSSRLPATQPESSSKDKETGTSALERSGIPTSSLSGEPTMNLKKRSSANVTTTSTESSSDNQSRKRRLSELDSLPDLPPWSPFAKSRITGTTSAKLSYLMSRILQLYKTEKCLIFYEGDNLAYYIAQALEALHINHEIYAKSLKADQKAEYVVRFETASDIRVLLMDINQAAHGLNIPSASRIFIVNPVCRPNVEAQAIKRAHRIGQTRPVRVETLVLRGTIEEKMFERSRRMTHSEHKDAKALDDDDAIGEMIRNIQPLPISDGEFELAAQMAPLEHPEKLWSRPGWRESMRLTRGASGKRRKKKKAGEDVNAGPEKNASITNERSTTMAG